jgi:TonB family protein
MRFVNRIVWFAVLISVSIPAVAQDARRVIRASAPAYPDLMYAAGTQGKFIVAVTVLPSGEVDNVVVMESVARYVDPVLRAHAKRWRFEQQEHTSVQMLEFAFRLLPVDAPSEELGTIFVTPMTMEICRTEPPSYVSRTGPQSPPDSKEND